MLLEAGVIAVGFMNGVISGKNYSRAINAHKVMAKTLERLLLNRYLETRCVKYFCCNLLLSLWNSLPLMVHFSDAIVNA